jgi:hypothetical protein
VAAKGLQVTAKDLLVHLVEAKDLLVHLVKAEFPLLILYLVVQARVKVFLVQIKKEEHPSNQQILKRHSKALKSMKLQRIKEV